jgi:multidrug resistance efflux pump
MTTDKPISIPITHRWRRFRLRWLPQLVFVLSVIAVGVLWRQHGEFANAVGEVEAVRVDVAAASSGQLMPLSQASWTSFDSVQQGQLIARLDDSLLSAELQTLDNELAGLKKRIAATETKLKFDQADFGLERQREAMRLAWQIEQLRLEGLDRDVKLAMDEVEIQRLEAKLDVLKPLIKGGYSSELEAIDAKALRDAAVARVKSARVARAEVAEQFALANDRANEMESVEQPEVDTILESVLGPVRAALATQQSKIDGLVLRLQQLEIRSPITGTITEIHAWPGQVVQSGESIVTVAANQGRYIVSYLHEDQIIQPDLGDVVSVHSRSPGATHLKATITRIGPQVQRIPPHQLADRTTPKWGVPLRIELPSDLNARPGELVQLRFSRSR